MVNDLFFFQILGLASTGVSTLLSVGLAVVGLAYVRPVHALAGFCLAGAGALGAFVSFIRRFVGLASSFGGGGSTIYTASQIFTTLVSIFAGLLIPVGIFLLASAVKQRSRAGA